MATKKIKMCGEKPCSECPFTKTSLPGWLSDYTVQDFLNFVQFDVPFPCHMVTPPAGVKASECGDLIQKGELQLCRGYAEMMKKSCKMPRPIWMNQLLQTLEIHDGAMNTQEFIQHHSNPIAIKKD